MKPFIETEEAKYLINNFIKSAKEYEEQNKSPEEQLISEQKTRLYKFWCFITYGHLMVRGTCLRCGKTEPTAEKQSENYPLATISDIGFMRTGGTKL